MKAVSTAKTQAVIGEAQGYEGLPICRGTIDGVPFIETAWEPSPDELAALQRGKRVVVTILGTQHPPIKLEVEQ